MRAKIKYHSGLFGSLKYNFNKVANGEAIHLSHSEDIFDNNFRSTYGAMLEKGNKKKLADNTIHVSLNFQPGTPIDEDTMRKVADEYIKGMGWENNTYSSFIHTDRFHPHLHIVCVREKNVYNEFKKSKNLETALISKYNLIPERSAGQKHEIGKMCVKNQIKTSLDRIKKMKNVYSIDDVQRVFNSVSPGYKMMINKEKQTISFAHEFNKSYIESNNLQDNTPRSLFKLLANYRNNKENEDLQPEDLDTMQEIIPDSNTVNNLLQWQFKKTTANVEEFNKEFQKHFAGFSMKIRLDNNQPCFVNPKTKQYFSLVSTINASTLYSNTTYKQWEKTLSKNIANQKQHEKEHTIKLRKAIQTKLLTQLAKKEINDFDSLKETLESDSIHLVFYGNTNAEHGHKQITGWSVYDENSGFLFKMSDIDRGLSYNNTVKIFAAKQNELAGITKPIPTRLPKNYYSALRNERSGDFELSLHKYKIERIHRQNESALTQDKDTNNSVSNVKTNIKSNSKSHDDFGLGI